ncbi:MAG: hypothetical protein H7X77_09250 [Anaerolineae bacterium]|nr:hypothetical protein [Anaerolineae bacterium]
MSVSAAWHNPERKALVMTFTAPWTWAEFEKVSPKIEAAIASVSHNVDVIIDMSRAGEIPASALDRLRNIYADATINLGDYLFVGADDDFKAMFAVADRYYTALGGSLTYHFAATLDEAINMQTYALKSSPG